MYRGRKRDKESRKFVKAIAKDKFTMKKKNEK